MPDWPPIAIAMTLPTLSSSLPDPRAANHHQNNHNNHHHHHHPWMHPLDSTPTPSEPQTPTFSLRGHSRFPSSNSSLTLTPPHDVDVVLATSRPRLSKLAEEPPEREHDCIIVDLDEDLQAWHCLCVEQPCAHTGPASSNPHHLHYSDAWLPASTLNSRSSSTSRRATESPTASDSIASKFTSRFHTWRRRKPVLTIGTPVSTPTRNVSSRSSSLSSGAVPGLDSSDYTLDPFAPSPVEPTRSNLFPAPIRIPTAAHSPDPIDRDALARTPLLPPMIGDARRPDTPQQSPLQSPTVANSKSSFPLMGSPLASPQLRSHGTPPLSNKASVASFRMRTATLASSCDSPTVKKSDRNDKCADKWAMKLGHANFTIYPEPYMPAHVDCAVVKQLFSDWEAARHNFTVHQVRTGEHYGVTSKAYILSEEKWSEIDTQWRKNYDAVFAEVCRNSPETPRTPEEPAPLAKIPSLHHSHDESKFPSLGDQDVVGPMTVVAPRIQPAEPKNSRTGSLFRLFCNFKSSTSSSPSCRR